MRSCNNCIWYDRCDHVEVCDNYDPAVDSDETFYRGDLAERHALYQEQIEEQDN